MTFTIQAFQYYDLINTLINIAYGKIITQNGNSVAIFTANLALALLICIIYNSIMKNNTRYLYEQIAKDLRQKKVGPVGAATYKTQ